MTLERWVAQARELGASDVHLEPGLPAAFRVRGALQVAGEPVSPAALQGAARAVVGEGEAWEAFLARRSFDGTRTLAGVRCRLHVLCSSRGVGLAVRLLTSFQATVRSLNLHPDLKRLAAPGHGLVLVSGPTGSGKTSTLCALLQEVNLGEPRHVVTVESPIEHLLLPRRAFIRQREVGRDTPSFEQALLDALREDPDVLMVGELREPSTMRLTLNAAETGHLVLATLHSGSCAEALARLVASFPAEQQPGVCAQLADCLVGVVCQRLVWREELSLRLPECEVLMASTQVRAMVRAGQFHKLASALETGGADGSWSFARYRDWMERKTDWVRPEPSRMPEEAAPLEDAAAAGALAPLAAPPPAARPLPVLRMPPSSRPPERPRPAGPTAPAPADAGDGAPAVDDGRLVIQADDEDPARVLEELERASRPGPRGRPPRR
jgi:twitching motility protein PilT